MQCFQANRHSSIPVVAVTGNKNSGKTTAIEEMVRHFGRKGYRLGTLKHCHCEFDVDRPGTDSWRHRRAGSAGTAVIGEKGIALMADRPEEDDPERLAAWLFPNCDLVLAEGFHWQPLPRVEILNADDTTRKAHADGEVLAQLPHGFGRAEIERVCDSIIAHFFGSGRIQALA